MQESNAAQESSIAVACLGEALALVLAAPTADRAGLEHRTPLAGAEANVAAGLAAQGVPAAWVGRLGADALGELVRAELSARGVEVRGGSGPRPAHRLLRQARHPATPGSAARRLRYCRSGSAASAMDPGSWTRPAVADRLARAAAGARQRDHRGALRLVRGADATVARRPAGGSPGCCRST